MTERTVTDRILDVLSDAQRGIGSVEVAWRLGISMDAMVFALSQLYERGLLDMAVPQGTLKLSPAGEVLAAGLRG